MEKQTKYPELKQLSLSILGTAIGVGLTLFANNRVDYSRQRSAQHETAIMAVCDIDEIAQGLKDEIQLEDSLFQVTMYVSSHQELIDSLSKDTLDRAFEYLYDDPTLVKPWTADTKENAFNSGIDARMNLGNNQFYDNVQSCYYVRRSLMKVMADAPMFRRPLSKDAYEDILYELPPTAFFNGGVLNLEGLRHVMKQVFAQKSTALYIVRYFDRKDVYKNAVTKLEGLNRENKLLMDITDEDIEKYIRQNSENISQQDIADLIVGRWVLNKDTIVFHEDSTFERTWVMEIQGQIQLKEEQQDVLVLIPTAVRTKGLWTLNGDTLTYDCDSRNAEMLSFDFDTSNFPQATVERLKDTLDFNKEMTRRTILEQFQQQTLKFDEVVSFDRSGNTMVWTHEETTPDGNKQTTSLHLFRKPE